MGVSFNSRSFPEGAVSAFLSAVELAESSTSNTPNDFLDRFRIIPTSQNISGHNKAGLFNTISSYTSRINRPEIVAQKAQSLLFPEDPITLERANTHRPDAALTLGACLMAG